MEEKLYIIDITSPIFVHHPEGLINWSKIPYSSLEQYFLYNTQAKVDIEENIIKYLKKVKSLGYNALSMDELSRLVVFPFYPKSLKKKMSIYSEYYRYLFKIAKKLGFKIFITTDVMFFNRAIEQYMRNSVTSMIELMKTAVVQLFSEYNDIHGIIFRIGESDGVDVQGDFTSNIVLKTPEDANLFIKELLPLFIELRKLFIFRTWTIGAYKCGDLMWNEKTYDKVFRDISSDDDNFIISMKYGNCDFFRFQSLNPLFHRDSIKKIVELQTRREYEGFGEFPSFTGWDYKEYHDELLTVESFAGIQVWCQTGGWSRFRNFTFLENTSYWNELNTFVTIKIFRNNMTVEEALASFYGREKLDTLKHFLRLSEKTIKTILYDQKYAEMNLFFNRVRIPPLLHISWDNVTITDSMFHFYRVFVKKREKSVNDAYETLEAINTMKELADQLQVPYNYNFHYDTFRLFAISRDLLYSKKAYDTTLINRLYELLGEYEAEYPLKYRFYVNLSSDRKLLSSFFARLAIRILVRKRKKYRLVDFLLFNRTTSPIYLLLFYIVKDKLPKFVNKQGMPVRSLFS